jgi:hypothetical protein
LNAGTKEMALIHYAAQIAAGAPDSKPINSTKRDDCDYCG